MNYALIENDIVVNIIWLLYSNAYEFPNAVPIGNLPVFIGDVYIEGKFYDSDGNEILSHYTKLQSKNEELERALNIVGVETREPLEEGSE